MLKKGLFLKKSLRGTPLAIKEITKGIMRPLTKLLLFSLLLVSSMTMAGSMDTVAVSGPKMKNVFVYKANRKFVGATVEIISANGIVITSSHLQKRKLIIDFGDVRLGAYTIRVSKGKEVEEIVYIKK
jgi:hypothetical protein